MPRCTSRKVLENVIVEVGQLANIIRSFIFANWHLSHQNKISTFPQILGDSSPIFFDDYISKSRVRVLAKDIPEL